MTTSRILSVALASAFFCGMVSAQPADTDQPSEIALLKEQLAVAKAELTARERFEERILSTVHWSLGTLGSISVALLGFGWFTSFKAYERDKKLIRDELSAVFDGKFKATLSRLEKQNDETIKKRVRDATAEFSDDLTRMRISAQENEATTWRSKGVFANELRLLNSALTLSVELEDEYQAGRCLDKIETSLDSLKSENTVKPDAHLESETSSALERARKLHPLTVDRLLRKLAELKP